MIKEAYCSDEVSLLLQAKGFPQTIEGLAKGVFQESKLFVRPTQQVAMRWLREVHKLSATIGFGNGFTTPTCFYMSIVKMEPGAKHLSATMRFETYEEAVEAALRYCLTKLI